MIVGVLTTCRTQYTWNRRICIFLFNKTTLQVFVTYLTGALYVHPLWFYKHQHDNRVRSKQNAFSLPFAAILVNRAPSGEMHNYCTPRIIKENFENFLIHWCNYILLSQAYCVWQVVKTPTVILNNPVYLLPLLTLQPTIRFGLLSDSLPFCSLFTLLSPPSYSHYLHIFFDICNPSLPWSPSNSCTYRFPL